VRARIFRGHIDGGVRESSGSAGSVLCVTSLTDKATRPPWSMRDGRLLRWVAQTAAKRPVGLFLALYAFGTDWLTGWHGMNFAMRGLLDEPAHLATALIILGALVRFRGPLPDQRFGWTMLVCSVLIDVDHLPRRVRQQRPDERDAAAVHPRAVGSNRSHAGLGRGPILRHKIRKAPACGGRTHPRGRGLGSGRALRPGYRDRTDVILVAGHRLVRPGALLVVRGGVARHHRPAAGNPVEKSLVLLERRGWVGA
jgi:hypothetical protein